MPLKSFPILLLLAALNVSGQSNSQPPCNAPQTAQFDFWVGDWNLTWQDSLHATNRIEKILGGCTVHENFNDAQRNYKGQSWTVYNTITNQWQQTWVDDKGGYIALTGNKQGDKMILQTGEQPTPKGKMTYRMVYYNILPDSFDWSWESSSDKGINWKPNWQIHYDRKQ